MERVAGIEPASSAWKAEVLPLNYTRQTPLNLVEGGGFEPPKLARQIYSLIPLATREPLRKAAYCPDGAPQCQPFILIILLTYERSRSRVKSDPEDSGPLYAWDYVQGPLQDPLNSRKTPACQRPQCIHARPAEAPQPGQETCRRLQSPKNHR